MLAPRNSLTAPAALSTEWTRTETPKRYHGAVDPDFASWPRRVARRLLRTGQYPMVLFRWLPKLPAHPHIIDIGCGTGRTLAGVAQARPDATVYGVDLAPVDNLTNHPIHKIAADGRFYQANLLEDHNVPRGRFDLVYSSNVIEHVPDGVAFLRAMSQLAKPGGLVLVHTMNHWGTLVGFYNDPTHIRPYPAEALRRAALMVGIEPVEARHERCWSIMAFAPVYKLYCLATRKRTTASFFWEHALAVQSTLVARVPASIGKTFN